MSIFAGILSRDRSELSDAACDALRRALSRDSRDTAVEFRDRQVFLAKVDFNAFGAPGFQVQPGRSVSLLAGEPLLPTDCDDAGKTRDVDLEALTQSWNNEDWNVLRRACGTFCAAHYDVGTTRLSLVADRVGLRPIYYWIGEHYVVFATALRVLEQHPLVPKRLDIRGVTETACLEAPLADRTPYEGVQTLRAAEIVQVLGTAVKRSQYWRWDAIQPSSAPESQLLRTAHARFTKAVARRLRGDTASVAFLSGGLDSRCVVATLRQQGARVYTFNFGLPGTQDQVLGEAFARATGTSHEHVSRPVELKTRFSTLMAHAWEAAQERGPSGVERPHLAWSGDGGSLIAGHIYLTRAMIDALRAGRPEEAIDLFLEQQRAHVATRLLQPGVRAALAAAPRQGIREELADLHNADVGRHLFLFLLHNDQRRHEAQHFEDLDLHRIELQFPFFDADFVTAMLQVPIDLALYHRFYHQWLGLFPPVVTAVPWQTYPGHLPCPLPVPAGLHYQWSRSQLPDFERPRRRELLRRAREMLRSRDFPHLLLRKASLRVATLLYRARLRDYGYALEQASLYHTYWTRSTDRSGEGTRSKPLTRASTPVTPATPSDSPAAPDPEAGAKEGRQVALR